MTNKEIYLDYIKRYLGKPKVSKALADIIEAACIGYHEMMLEMENNSFIPTADDTRLTNFEYNGNTYYHSPELKSWQEWMDWANANGYQLLSIDESCSIPYETLIKLPDVLAGSRHPDGTFISRGSHAGLWSSRESGGNAWRRYLYPGNATVYRNTNAKAYGFSVVLKKKSESEGE